MAKKKNRKKKTAFSGLFGGLSGGVFFFGLAIAIVWGHFATSVIIHRYYLPFCFFPFSAHVATH